MSEAIDETPMVRAVDLRKDYGSTHAVQGMSFEVNRGEVVGFLGPNGAGKTTTMKMLTGFLRPTGGGAEIGGVSVAGDPLQAQAMLGYLPENAPMYDDMMVIDYLRFAARLRGIEGEQQRERLRVVVQRCGLMDVLGKDLGHLSKGFRQRAGLAQALVHDPDLLVLDEPTSGLDPNQIVEIRKLIRELGKQKTIILSTHILPEVQATCDRIMIINEGQLVADDTPEALTGDNAGAVIKVVVKPKGEKALNQQEISDLFANLSGVGRVDHESGEGGSTLGFSLRAQGSADPREELFSAAQNNDLILLDMHRERVSLEDTFRRLTA